MSKPTDIKKVREFLRLKFGSHLSNRDVAKSLNVGSSTVSDNVIRFNNTLLSWPLPDSFSDDSLISKIHPVKNVTDIPHLFQDSNYFHLKSRQAHPQRFLVLPVELFSPNIRIAKPTGSTARHTLIKAKPVYIPGKLPGQIAG